MLTEQELTESYQEHTGPLYAYVSRRVGGDRVLAEDVVQDTWLRSIGSWRKHGIPDHPKAWLIHVARNLLASHFRRKRPVPVDPAELTLEADGCSPETPSAAALVNWGLTRLSKRQATLLEAFYFNDKSTRELADQSGLSERAVEGRLRRARRNLEKHLRKYYGSEPSGGSLQTSGTVLELSEDRRNHVE